MKVLFYIRENYERNIAGDAVQLIATVKYLIARGIEVEISSDYNKNLTEFDIIHLFNTSDAVFTYYCMKNALKYKKKTVLTPIHWDYTQYLPQKGKCSNEKYFWKEQNIFREKIFSTADLILPGSEKEMRSIEDDFGINKSYIVVPSGVDREFLNGNGEAFIKRYKINDFVLCVGRICPHKNQLTISRITKKLGIPVVMVGPVNDLDYYYKCKRANSGIIYITEIKHNELRSIYHAAKVHALVSWYEIPGLVNLEAGLAGCNVLTTDEGSTKECFKDYVYYANHKNYDEIEKKLIATFNEKKDDKFKNYIIENYLWERIVEKIANAYITLACI